MSGKYYPNNWEAIQDAPDELFEPCSVEEFWEWKLNGWMMPSSVSCIMRAEHKATGKIKEHTYKSPKSAVKKLVKYMDTGEYEVTICNHDSISLVGIRDDDTDDD